jgi:hypothetical protein
VKHPVYRAFAELGKAIKTIFLCRYLNSMELRREINEGLNIIENYRKSLESKIREMPDRRAFGTEKDVTEEITSTSPPYLFVGTSGVLTMNGDSLINPFPGAPAIQFQAR